jgi:ATP-dependent DNA helicase RecG
VSSPGPGPAGPPPATALDGMELEALSRDLESDRTERKESLADPEKIKQAICAFANDLPDHRRPGVLFVGLKDNGTCAGLSITDKVLTELAGFRSDGWILPFPSMAVSKVRIGTCDVAIAVVQPSDDTPVRCRGVVWIRVGPRRAQANPQDERILTEKRRSRDTPFDLRPVFSASIDDLDRKLFEEEYLPSLLPSGVNVDSMGYLESLQSARFATVDPPVHPTVTGLLVVGRDPPSFMPGARVQFYRVAGNALTDPVREYSEISGPLSQLIRSCLEKLRANVGVASPGSQQTAGTTSPDYPIEALHQLVLNAVLHRTYEATNAPIRISWFDDRVEIQSPGGFYGIVSEDRFGVPGITDYRNPHLAEAMKVLGHSSRFGIGLQKVKSELDRNGNPPYELEGGSAHMALIVRKRP